MADIFGESSNDSDGALSINSEPRNTCNQLQTTEEFLALPDTTVSRDRWIPGYRDRVLRSSSDTIPWSARRISLICISGLDLDLFFHHYSKLKGYIFPVQPGKVEAHVMLTGRPH